MLSQLRPQPPGQPSTSASPRILTSRSQYRSCHVRVPDQEQRLAAVFVDHQYYSFFKVLKDEAKALEVASRLARRGDETLITKTGKGYAIWVLEPEAQADAPAAKVAAQASNAPTNTAINASGCQILTSRTQYQPCHVRVPDLEQRLAAIYFNGKYYSLLKVIRDEQPAIDVATRLTKRGNETLVIKNTKDYTVWVLEPDARPDF